MEQQLEDELKLPEIEDGKPLRLTKTIEICGYCGNELDDPTLCYICEESICPKCEGHFGIKPPDQQEKKLETTRERMDRALEGMKNATALLLGYEPPMERKIICRSCFPTFIVELDKAIGNTKNIVKEK